MCREAVVGNDNLLHAINKMVESCINGTTHRCRFTGGGIKPPEGAVVKSYGTERLGKDIPRVYQVWIQELNENEPLMRSREVATLSQKPRSMKRGDECSGNLFTGCTAGVLQMARPVSGLIYGTREPA